MGTLETLKTELIASEGYNNQTKPIRSHTLHFLELIAKKLKIRVRQFKKKLQIRVEISTPRLLYQITYENYFRHEIDLNEGFVGKCAYLLYLSFINRSFWDMMDESMTTVQEKLPWDIYVAKLPRLGGMASENGILQTCMT